VAVLDAGEQAGGGAAGVDRHRVHRDRGELDRLDLERSAAGRAGEEQALTGADREHCVSHGIAPMFASGHRATRLSAPPRTGSFGASGKPPAVS
jgi:hypothetical protein